MAVRSTRYVPAPESHVPSEKLPHPRPSMLIVAPMFERECRIASIDLEAFLGGDVPVADREFAKQPRFDQRASRCHDRGTPRGCQAFVDLVREEQIPVPDD